MVSPKSCCWISGVLAETFPGFHFGSQILLQNKLKICKELGELPKQKLWQIVPLFLLPVCRFYFTAVHDGSPQSRRVNLTACALLLPD